MPEITTRPRYNVKTLSSAHEGGQLVRVECVACNIKRHYLPGDLQKLVGDIPFWDVEKHMRCVKCRRKDNLRADLDYPSAAERVTMRVRRLAEIKMVRRVIWRDE